MFNVIASMNTDTHSTATIPDECVVPDNSKQIVQLVPSTLCIHTNSILTIAPTGTVMETYKLKPVDASWVKLTVDKLAPPLSGHKFFVAPIICC